MGDSKEIKQERVPAPQTEEKKDEEVPADAWVLFGFHEEVVEGGMAVGFVLGTPYSASDTVEREEGVTTPALIAFPLPANRIDLILRSERVNEMQRLGKWEDYRISCRTTDASFVAKSAGELLKDEIKSVGADCRPACVAIYIGGKFSSEKRERPSSFQTEDSKVVKFMWKECSMDCFCMRRAQTWARALSTEIHAKSAKKEWKWDVE